MLDYLKNAFRRADDKTSKVNHSTMRTSSTTEQSTSKSTLTTEKCTTKSGPATDHCTMKSGSTTEQCTTRIGSTTVQSTAKSSSTTAQSTTKSSSTEVRVMASKSGIPTNIPSTEDTNFKSDPCSTTTECVTTEQCITSSSNSTTGINSKYYPCLEMSTSATTGIGTSTMDCAVGAVSSEYFSATSVISGHSAMEPTDERSKTPSSNEVKNLHVPISNVSSTYLSIGSDTSATSQMTPRNPPEINPRELSIDLETELPLQTMIEGQLGTSEMTSEVTSDLADNVTSSEEIDVIFKLVNDHLHSSSECVVVGLEDQTESSSTSTNENKESSSQVPKFMRHVKLPILHLLKTFKKNQVPGQPQVINQYNPINTSKPSSKSFTSESSINKNISSMNDIINSTFLSLPTLPENTSDLVESIAFFPGVPNSQRAPRHYVYQDGDPTLYYPQDESHSSENLTSESLSEREVMSYASLIRSHHSRSLSNSNSESMMAGDENQLEDEDDGIIFCGFALVDNKYPNIHDHEKMFSKLSIDKDEFRHDLFRKMKHEEKNPKPDPEKRERCLTIKYYDGVESAGKVFENTKSNDGNGRMYSQSQIGRLDLVVDGKCQSHDDLTHTSEVHLKSHSHSCPNKLEMSDSSGGSNTQSIPKNSRKIRENSHLQEIFDPSARIFSTHSGQTEEKSPVEMDSFSVLSRINSDTESTSLHNQTDQSETHVNTCVSVDSSVSSSTSTLKANNSMTLLFESSSCAGGHELRNSDLSEMVNVTNIPLSITNSSAEKRKSYLEIKKSHNSVSKVSSNIRFSSEAIKEVLNKSKENMSRYASRVMKMSRINIPTRNSTGASSQQGKNGKGVSNSNVCLSENMQKVSHDSRNQDEKCSRKSMGNLCDHSSDTASVCKKHGTQGFQNSNNKSTKNKIPFPNYFKNLNQGVLNSTKDIAPKSTPTAFNNYRRPISFRNGTLTLNSNPEVSKLDNLLDDLELSSFSENDVQFQHPHYSPINLTIDEGSYGDEAILRGVDEDGEEISNAQWLDGLHDYYTNLEDLVDFDRSNDMISHGSANTIGNLHDGIPIVRSMTYTVLEHRGPIYINKLLDNLEEDKTCWKRVLEEERILRNLGLAHGDETDDEGDMFTKLRGRDEGRKRVGSVTSIISNRTYSLGPRWSHRDNRYNYYDDDSAGDVSDFESVSLGRTSFIEKSDNSKRKKVTFKLRENDSSFEEISQNHPERRKDNLSKLEMSGSNKERRRMRSMMSQERNPREENWGVEWSKWDLARKKRQSEYVAKNEWDSEYYADTERSSVSSGTDNSELGSLLSSDDDSGYILLTRKSTYTLI